MNPTASGKDKGVMRSIACVLAAVALVLSSLAVGAAERLAVIDVTVDGIGRYLVPGFWDMHVHSHRAGRWRYHYPLFLAHGVVGGSPPLDGSRPH